LAPLNLIMFHPIAPEGVAPREAGRSGELYA
jgi:hypothetical protein